MYWKKYKFDIRQEFEERLNLLWENKYTQSEDGEMSDLIYTFSKMKKKSLFAFSINQFYNYTNGTANHCHIIFRLAKTGL